MTDDAIKALERVARILNAGRASSQAVAEFLPEYARGAEFVYQLAAETIEREIGYIKKDRAARAPVE